MLASGHMNGSLCFWDKRSNKSIHEITGLHTQQIVSLAMGGRTGFHLNPDLSHKKMPCPSRYSHLIQLSLSFV